jgi:hypothetical protein
LIYLQESYKLRSIRFIEFFDELGWRMKVYGISYKDEFPTSNLVEIAKNIAREELPQPAITDNRYGVGFICVHEARDANFFLIDWWSDENALNHHIYVSSFDAPANAVDITLKGPNMCVWELRVIGYERQAWLNNVLANPKGPDLEAYLNFRLNENV